MTYFHWNDGGAGGSGGGTEDTDSSKTVGNEDTTGSASDKGQDKNVDPGNKSSEKTETLDELKAKNADLKSENAKLTKNIGKQANDLGKKAKSYDTIVSALKDNPQVLIDRLAKEHGGTVSFGNKSDPNKDILEALNNEDPEIRKSMATAISNDASKNDMESSIMSKLSPTLSLLQEQGLATKYQDFDEFGDDRDDLDTKLQLGTITKTEVLHLAARGNNMSEALKEAGVEAVEAFKKELAEKNKGQIDTTGTSDSDESRKGNANMADLTEALSVLTTRQAVVKKS